MQSAPKWQQEWAGVDPRAGCFVVVLAGAWVPSGRRRSGPARGRFNWQQDDGQEACTKSHSWVLLNVDGHSLSAHGMETYITDITCMRGKLRS
jgi:hypothetical protein